MAIIAMLLAFFFLPQEGFMAKQMKKMKYKYLWTWTWRNKPETLEAVQVLGPNSLVPYSLSWQLQPPETLQVPMAPV